MRISCRWLSKYIDLPPEIDKLTQTLTFTGIEVEGVESLAALPESVVTARVLSADKIPGSDHLVVCSVEYGSGEPVQVVCGAPNCKAGMISILALPGTVLPQLAIKKAKVRGVESAGMLCSERELGVSDNHAGIIELDPETPIGISANEVYDLPDTLLELEITPNRPDLLGYLGIARDLSASLGVPLKLPQIQEHAGEKSQSTDLDLRLEDSAKCPRYTARLMADLKVQESPQWLKTALIKSGLRPINNIVDITNYVMLETGHPLHAFDYDKLLPLDKDGAHPAIVVRKALPKEEFLALDGRAYVLDEEDLVIADGQRASALAGVMGGKDTGITESTQAIVLEAATFSPMTVRSTAYKHKISTDSSYRFERHLSTETPAQVSARAVDLLLEVAGGRVCNALYDAYPEPHRPSCLGIRPRRFEELIGYPLPSDTIIKYLEALDCRFLQYGTWQDGLATDLASVHCLHLEEQKAGKAEFTEIDCDHALYFLIPSFRVDLTREADLLEELARLEGYDKIPQKTAVSQIMDRHAHRVRRAIEDYFVNASFYEMLNYSFSDPAQLALLAFEPEELDARTIRLINPQSGNQSAMRLSLLPQLLVNLSYNLNHGERDLKLMEMGKVYLREGDSYREPYRLTALLTGKFRAGHWKEKSENINVYHVKGLAEGLLKRLNIPVTGTSSHIKPWLVSAENLAYHSGETLCASIGRLRSETAEAFQIDIPILKQDIWVLELEVENLVELTRDRKPEFIPLPKYPAVIRDISFVISRSVAYAEIEAAIKACDRNLIRNVQVFDEYRGKQVPEGSRSISLRIVMQDGEKTLTDERVDQLIASVLQMLQDTWQINMR
ncbi:MAG: phenylalanine--tRNA ligase subunit beta [Candidatus Syntrophosphaera sp.]|nr:phenylalanine--tRNA ligase subunit beta [Candidatus Syntrophosphaera sp.]